MSGSGGPPPGALARAVTEGQFSLADALGGPRGVAESVVPGVVFVVVFTLAGRRLDVALWSAGGSAAALALVRLVRRETLQHTIVGLLGVGFGAVLAQRSGRAENFFLPSLLKNGGFAAAYLISIAVRWPLLGVALGPLTGEGMAWRRDPARLRAYTRASWVWTGMFVVRIAVLYPLYQAGAVGALGVASVLLGLPLFALAAFLSWLILRQQGSPASSPAASPAGATPRDTTADEATPSPG